MPDRHLQTPQAQSANICGIQQSWGTFRSWYGIILTLLLQAAGATGTFAFTARAETPGAEQLTVAQGCLTSLVRGPVTAEGCLQMLSLAHKGAQRAAALSRLSLTRAHDFL